jgi:hypothetical protein
LEAFGEGYRKPIMLYKQSLMGDSDESSENQNAGRNAEVKTGLMSFQMETRTLLRIALEVILCNDKELVYILSLSCDSVKTLSLKVQSH